ncbi:MAG: type IV pilus biogenesis protein PilM, partial [Dehalococcoidales bacterium]
MAEEKDASRSQSQSVLNLDLGTAVRKLTGGIGRLVSKWAGAKVVTLDIDSTGIRLLETRGGVVRRWADTSFEPGKAEEEASDALVLGRAVRQLMASSGIKANKVIASLSGLYSVSRILSESSLPPAPTTNEAVLELANEIMPLPENRRYLSWQTITADEGERVFLTVGVAREVVDNEMRALRAAGVTPQIIELRAMALIRAVNREQAFILNIEPSSFDIIIVVKGMPEIMRTIAWRQDDLIMEDTVEYLASVLEMTVDFYNSSHLETPLDQTTPLFITGQMSVNLDLVEKLKARSAYPVEPLLP